MPTDFDRLFLTPVRVSPKRRSPAAKKTADRRRRILMLEDASAGLGRVRSEIERSGIEAEIRVAHSRDSFEKALISENPDLVLADDDLPGFSGMAALSLAKAAFPEIPVVIVSGGLDEESAVACMKAGADDCILKDRIFRLVPAVKSALRAAADSKAKRMAEADLSKRTEELETTNRELQQFAWVASHDLREPLRKIVNFSDLLNAKQWGLDDESVDYLSRIRGAAERLNHVIEDLLRFTSVQGSRVEMVDISLTQPVRQALTSLQPKIIESGAEIKVGPLPTVTGDLLQLSLLFEALLDNSLKYRMEGRAPVIEVTASRVNASERISVTDNGMGFDQRYERKIFEPFKTLHRKKGYAGTGIGLAICHKIVQNHRGRIEVKSELGKGSTFSVIFPNAPL